MIGGMVSSTVLTLIVIPAFTAWSKAGGSPKPVSLSPRRSSAPPSEGKYAMMDQMMGGGMMWGMGLFGLLVIIVLVLGAAALVKYLFFTKGR
jgi:hypothetical protein